MSAIDTVATLSSQNHHPDFTEFRQTDGVAKRQRRGWRRQRFI
jgi:hypothetical protein